MFSLIMQAQATRRNGFFGGNFLFRISELTQRERINVHFANYRFSFRKLQIFISQTTDSYFANYRFSFRKLQIFISQTTDSHFANCRFSFRKLQISISQTTDFHFVSSHFVSQTTVSHSVALWALTWILLLERKAVINKVPHLPTLPHDPEVSRSPNLPDKSD